MSANVDYFEADVISYADYYPFGQDMPGRGGSMANYRYGYNGKEKDNEISGAGNSYDFGARLYNPRLCRWLSREPKEANYPKFSPYSSNFNNPILFEDPDGKDPIVTIISYSYDRYNNQIDIKIRIIMPVYVINGSSVAVDMQNLISRLNSKGWDIQPNEEGGTLHGKIHNEKVKLDVNGNVSPNGTWQRVSTINTIASITYIYHEIPSLDYLENTDNIIIIVDEINLYDGGEIVSKEAQGHSGNDGVMTVNVDAEDLIHTIMHETTHELGAFGEQYIENDDGTATDAGTGDVMDLSGFYFGTQTIGEIGSSILGDIANEYRPTYENIDEAVRMELKYYANTNASEVNTNARKHNRLYKKEMKTQDRAVRKEQKAVKRASNNKVRGRFFGRMFQSRAKL